MAWDVSDPVEVRSNDGQPWLPGVVTAVYPHCYRITLDTPLTANDWLGATRKHKGTELIAAVDVLKHCENLVPDMHIRTLGG